VSLARERRTAGKKNGKKKLGRKKKKNPAKQKL
jgi:hypothetical protein